MLVRASYQVRRTLVQNCASCTGCLMLSVHGLEVSSHKPVGQRRGSWIRGRPQKYSWVPERETWTAQCKEARRYPGPRMHDANRGKLVDATSGTRPPRACSRPYLL